jgi:hypothetical protein
VQIAMIETGAQHANQHLAGADIWNRHVIDADNFASAVGALEAMQTGGFHRAVHLRVRILFLFDQAVS